MLSPRRRALLRHRRALALAAALTLALLTALSGLGARVDRLLDPPRAAAWVRAPSGQVVVVEMDAASVAAIREWPWSRDHYARAVDRLRAAGAASITFDVDFSSAGPGAGDAALARAIARAPGLVALPTFAQRARSDDRRTIDSLPLPALRDGAALASVSMQPDADGIVRRAPFGTVTAGTPRPSLSALIAHRSGAADSFFPIDGGIDPARLPRLSFVAVRDGRFDPAAVRGRDVLIGATAIEMGDRYATPHWGVIPGVVVQALAAETLLAGVPGERSSALPLLVALLLSLPMLLARRGAVAAGLALGAPAALFALAVWAQVARHAVFPLAPALVLVVAAGLARVALDLARRFERQRRVDEDTGLPNRRALLHDKDAAAPTPLLVASLGNADALVTLLGERAGHDLLLRVADRLRATVGATVYRVGERLLAVDAPGDDVEALVAALRATLTEPVEILGRRADAAVHLGVSAGEGTIHDRLVSATRAADEAAAAGAFWRHAHVDAEALERRLVLMGELDQAIADGEIEVHYQPKLALATDRVASAEALVRWRHPVRGMIRPDLFIPLAEQADRIGALTLHVLARAVADLAAWRARGHDVSVAINLSAMLIAEPAFSMAVDALLDSGAVPADRLIFEVTESATLADPERAAAQLRHFRAKGVAISMDDYGTGQSTLTYLRELPLSELKIDRSFVQHAHLNPADALMVRSTIDLAHGLGLKVVAEGIEEPGCLALLRDAGCDLVQGYLIGRPMVADAFVATLEQRAAA
ncbi:EAL domain-containing protein [Sphingomonas sp. BK580]|uniref:putative bifunctional diguanylate cyclase/phosphodiesterase n=1 Tax=Sphingomonas sp. BK580 TaxID=2586972 RepID=UPI00161DC65A|nr:EAL domain-containing protein [Sphingomonas sp. BK580]MBB3694020.1 EAL domain-containing protein (putative c-di-GMP-specific phosphodiesterase class I)/CHASE2 domain-containing sensor protein [Sphingomonas sp. BK580]